jgi:RND superfamily putative drug exporter
MLLSLLRRKTVNALFTGIARFSIRRRKAVIFCWLALVVIGVILYLTQQWIFERESETQYKGEAQDAADLIAENFVGLAPYTQFLVLRGDRPATDADFEEAGRAVLQTVLDTGKVKDGSVYTYWDTPDPTLISEDEKATLILLGLDASTFEEAVQRVDDVMDAVENAEKPDWLQAYVAGEEAAWVDMIEASINDMVKAELIGEPVALLILLVVFGSLIAALLPLGMGIAAIAVTLGIIMILGRFLWVTSMAQEMVAMLGLGVGIDYALFIVTRYREELKRGKDVDTAIVETITHSGKAIAFSGVCVIIGISAMFFVDVAMITSIVVGMIIVVVMAILSAVTFMPALLSYIGTRIEWPERLTRQILRLHPGGGFWHRWATMVMARPWPFFIGAVVILVLLAAPTTRMRLWEPSAEQISTGYMSRDAYDLAAEYFDQGILTPIQIVIQFDREIVNGATIDEGAGATIADLSKKLKQMPEISDVQSLSTLDPTDPLQYLAQLSQVINVGKGQDTTVIYAYPAVNPTSADGLDLIPRIRDEIVPSVEGIEQGQRVLVGGVTAMMYDLLDDMYGEFPLIVALILVFTFIVLMVLFRSLLIPLKAVLMNLMALLATFGILVLVVQDGRLGFPANGAVIGDVPIFTFAILFGLSMDYEVFLLSRVRELHDRGADDRQSVAWGLEHTGGVITGAALIMVVVFGTFMLADLAMMREVGFAMATAVLLDATIVRIVLVPATMRLLGKWNWWLPGWLEHILPHVALEQDFDLETTDLQRSSG